MDVYVDVALDQEVVDGFDVLVFTRVCRPENGAWEGQLGRCEYKVDIRLTDSNSVLIAHVDAFFGVDDIAVSGAVYVLFLNVKVPARFL